jgi:uncharacterized protein YbaR (Trm112 family)
MPHNPERGGSRRSAGPVTRAGYNPSMPLHERDYFTQKTETKPMSLACPQCRHRDDYPIKWVRYTKKDKLPGGGERGLYDKLRDYLYRMDDMVNCSKCRRRFEIPSHQTTVFL